jgi:hypothetical protein
MRDLSKIKKAVAVERQSIPLCNLEKFDAETRSYLKEMRYAGPRKFDRLCDNLWLRTCWLKENDASAAPPLLCRKPFEPADQYLDRIYKAGGFLCPETK